MFYFLQHYPLIEIAIVKCRNGGIDCKVHGFTIVGTKKPANGELKMSASFLANDWDVNQDTQSVCKSILIYVCIDRTIPT